MAQRFLFISNSRSFSAQPDEVDGGGAERAAIQKAKSSRRDGLRDSKGGLYRKQFFTENKKKGPALYTPTVKHHLPFLDDLIIVEGFNDLKAVAEAVNATVLISNGTKLLNKSLRQSVTKSLQQFPSKIVLLDPDGEGRRMRTKLDEFVGPCLHAFVPHSLAMKKESLNVLDIKVGVEYCSPQTIQHALENPRMSVRGRKDITWDDLEDLNLVQPSGLRGDNVRARRMFFCNEIGIGLCDGSILVKQLNRWGFTWNDITEAAKESERRLAEWLEAKEREIALEASKLDYSESSEDEPI